MAVFAADPDLSWLYRDTRERLILLLSELDGAALATRVPAYPAWSVREVVAHLTAVSQDVLAGRPLVESDARQARSALLSCCRRFDIAPVVPLTLVTNFIAPVKAPRCLLSIS